MNKNEDDEMKKIFFLLIYLALASQAMAMKRTYNSDDFDPNEVCHTDLHDCKISIKNGESDSVIIRCSQYMLTKHSSYFSNKIIQKPSDAEMILDVNDIINKVSFPIFILALRVMHSTASNHPHIFSSDTIKEYFDLVVFYLDCDKTYYEKFFSHCTAIQANDKIKIFEQKPLSNHDEYEIYILRPFKSDIVKHYSDINKVFDQFNEFKRISPLGFKVLLEHDDFKADSENSIFLLFRLWLKEQNDLDIHQCLMPPLSAMRFNQMQDYYLGRFVVSFLEQHKLENFALKTAKNFLCRAKDGSKARPATPQSDGKKFRMKEGFSDVNTWKINEKYYSQKIYFDGYGFNFFFRVEPEGTMDGEYLAGYVRCTTEDPDPEFKLEAKIAFEFCEKTGASRKLPAFTATFEHSDRSLGCRICKPGETWKQIKDGLSSIVIDNTITVIVEIELI